MTQVPLQSGIATVDGWERRHRHCPLVNQAIQQARRKDGRSLLLFRGDRNRPPYLEHIFEIGQKARAAYHEGELGQLDYHPRRLSEDETLFRRIAGAFGNSPMARLGGLTKEQLVERYRSMGLRDRFWLSQLLIEGLQYQNCRREVRGVRDLLFVISFSFKEEVALRYALSFQAGEVPPQEAYVLEYAPPKRGRYVHRVRDVIVRFQEFGLGPIYRDRDDEVFVPYAALPHYLLGYSRLERIREEGNVYRVEYVANPDYAEGRATLDMPPDLEERQRQLMRDTLSDLAWVAYDPKVEDWSDLITDEGVSDLRMPDQQAGGPSL